jgi:hypothetical protein
MRVCTTTFDVAHSALSLAIAYVGVALLVCLQHISTVTASFLRSVHIQAPRRLVIDQSQAVTVRTYRQVVGSARASDSV